MDPNDDRRRWEARYRREPERGRTLPDPFVLEALDELQGAALGAAAPDTPRGRAVDLACGGGRHALELARRGWETEGWDLSPAGLELLRAEARQLGLAIRTREVDLSGPLPADGLDAFDLVLCVNYLDRSLLARVGDLLRPGGCLVFSTYTADHPGERPSARHRLRPGELTRPLPGLVSLRHREQGGRAELIARRPARPPRPPDTHPG